MKGLIIDAQVAGVSGDMFLGALLDLQFTEIENIKDADKKRNQLLQEIGSELPVAANLSDEVSLDLSIKRINQFALEGIKLEIKIKEPHRHLKVKQATEILENYCKRLKLSSKATEFSKTAITILFEAEAKAHGDSMDEVHLHEAGSLDTFLDIVGAAYLLDKMDLFFGEFYILPIALGSGTVTFSHGTLPVPAPAVAAIVKQYNLPVHLGHLTGELTTPTGAIILAALLKLGFAKPSIRSPIMTLEKTGVGFGSKKFKKTPNGLRLLYGTLADEEYPSEEIAIIETNLDDCSGEIIGFLTEKLFEMGAKDVFLTPIYMKKNRPATKITVLCKEEDITRFSTEIMDQTSTIGVRILRSTKLMLKREMKEFTMKINKKKFHFRGKIAYRKNGELAHFKPEFDDIKEIAQNTKLTINEIISNAREVMREELLK